MNKQFDRILRLARNTGSTFIIHDEETGRDLVVMSLEEYEYHIFGPGGMDAVTEEPTGEILPSVNTAPTLDMDTEHMPLHQEETHLHRKASNIPSSNELFSYSIEDEAGYTEDTGIRVEPLSYDEQRGISSTQTSEIEHEQSDTEDGEDPVFLVEPQA